jgi:hypothetical protein
MIGRVNNAKAAQQRRQQAKPIGKKQINENCG